MKIDSIIFDLDGTLWNSVEGICSAWKTVLAKYPDIKKVITYKEIEGYMGLPINEIGRRLFPDLPEDFQMRLMKECCETEHIYLSRHGGKLFPRLEETLKKLCEQYKLFIVSNCQDGYIQCFLKVHKLGRYFTDFESWEATGLSKGENNKLIIKRNDLKSSIYVGDTSGDAKSALDAEIPFVYARYGFGSVEKYDYVIDSFEEILNLGL